MATQHEGIEGHSACVAEINQLQQERDELRAAAAELLEAMPINLEREPRELDAIAWLNSLVPVPPTPPSNEVLATIAPRRK